MDILIKEFDNLDISDTDIDILVDSFQKINIHDNIDTICHKISKLEINEKIKSKIISIIYRKKCLMPIIHIPHYSLV